MTCLPLALSLLLERSLKSGLFPDQDHKGLTSGLACFSPVSANHEHVSGQSPTFQITPPLSDEVCSQWTFSHFYLIVWWCCCKQIFSNCTSMESPPNHRLWAGVDLKQESVSPSPRFIFSCHVSNLKMLRNILISYLLTTHALPDASIMTSAARVKSHMSPAAWAEGSKPQRWLYDQEHVKMLSAH